VAVLGAGSWGTALAIHLASAGASPRLWGRDRVLLERIAASRENARYLPGLVVPPRVTATADPAAALDGAATVGVAGPSAVVEGVIGAVRGCVPASAAVVSATKGLEPGRGRRISVLLGERLPGRPLAVLSGPSFAREVALGQPTALVVASGDEALARDLQRGLAGPALRLPTNRTVVGGGREWALAEGGAVGAGLSAGIGLGENARAALITRGLAEIARLGVALGAQPGTFLGLAGLGDLVLTCTGSLSRNRALGRAVAAGKTV